MSNVRLESLRLPYEMLCCLLHVPLDLWDVSIDVDFDLAVVCQYLLRIYLLFARLRFGGSRRHATIYAVFLLKTHLHTRWGFFGFRTHCRHIRQVLIAVSRLGKWLYARPPQSFILSAQRRCGAKGPMAFIRTLKAREILDSRGNPTIEAGPAGAEGIVLGLMIDRLSEVFMLPLAAKNRITEQGTLGSQVHEQFGAKR